MAFCWSSSSFVVAVIGFAVVASSKASGKRNAASLDDAKADARRVDRTPRRSGDQPDRHRRRLQAGAGRRLRALHRGGVSDRPGHHRAAGPARQGERDGGAVLRARRTRRDGHGSRTRTRVAVRSERRRAPSPRTAASSSRAARSRPRPSRRSARRTTTPAAGWPVGRCPPAGTPSRGGSPRWSPAPGASVRCCCSARCSPAWAASATTRRASRAATATASRTASTRASSTAAATAAAG